MSDDNKIQTIIPASKDGFLKNITDLVDEHRRGNIKCMMLCYTRKHDDSSRTYFTQHGDPELLYLLERIKHDMLSLYANDANVNEYESWDEDED